MKSIIEEASSIAKAIEQGWVRAGKPSEFTVKIFEEAQKNFLGFTSKPAKVGIFIPHTTPPHKGSPAREPHQSHAPLNARPMQKAREHQPRLTQPAQSVAPSAAAGTVRKVRELNTQWSEEYGSFAQEWLSQLLEKMALSTDNGVSKNITPDLLELQLDSPLSQDTEKQQILFKTLAHLTMEALRKKFNQNFRSMRLLIFVK